jgi:hypothetical protein
MDVTHIPLSLRHEPPVGYFSYSTNAHNIALATGGEYIPQFDKTSALEGQHIDMIDDLSWLIQQSIRLDKDRDTEERLLRVLHENAKVMEARVEVTSCYFRNPECGKTEYQNVDDNNMEFVANRHRLDAGGVCSLCNHDLETRNKDSLLLRIPERTMPEVVVRTPYLKKNINELFNNFGGKGLMISRLRTTDIQWNGYNIDNDFSNYISLYSATNGGEQKDLLYLASANTAMSVMGMIAVSSLLESKTRTTVAAMPKLSFTDREGKPVNITLPYLQEAGISRAAINLVLLQSLGANSEKLILESREFGLMERRLSSTSFVEAVVKNTAKLKDLEVSGGSLRIPNKQDVQRTLKELSTPNKVSQFNEENALVAKIIGSIVCRFFELD